MQRDIVKKTKDELGRNAKNILKIQKTTGREKQKGQAKTNDNMADLNPTNYI